MHRFSVTILWFAAAVALGSVGCDRNGEAEEKQQAPEEAPEETTEEEAESASLGGEDPRREIADTADRELRQTLMGRVMEVADSDGFAAAVDVCNEEAVPLTEEVGQEHGVEIGRVSDQLRNPDNTGPDWVWPMIEEADGQAHYEAGEQFRAVKPIRLAEGCTNCHGTEDQLADGVAEQLAEHYPDDEATGYEPGDLRGWVWVEVPEES